MKNCERHDMATCSGVSVATNYYLRIQAEGWVEALGNSDLLVNLQNKNK